MRDDFGSAEQDAMWERIRAKLPRYLAAPCEYNGHHWSDWSPYSRGVYARSGFEIIAVETGELRNCDTCASLQYRHTYFAEPHPQPMGEGWE